MAKWQNIVIEEPEEKKKQNLPIIYNYNEYGFGLNNGIYSLPEENRDFRKRIQKQIKTEAINTQNVLGNHISDETDRNIENTDARATEIKQKIQDHHNYVVNTIKPELNTIKQNTEDIKTTQADHTSRLAQIWNKISPWNY